MMFHMITNRTATLILDAAYVIWWVPEMIYSFTRRATINAKKADDGHSGAVLMACIWSGIFLAQALMYWGTLFSISWRPEIIFLLCVLFMIAGVAFCLYAIQVFGEDFTLQISTHHEQIVVPKGSYRF